MSIRSNFLLDGIKCFPLFGIDERKSFTAFFIGALKNPVGADYMCAKWLNKHTETLDLLLSYYDKTELAIATGQMLRVCSHFRQLSKALLMPDRISKLSSYFHVTQFDVCADSFLVYKELVFKSPQAHEYVSTHLEELTNNINSFLVDDHYTLCRLGLRFLSDMISTFSAFQRSYLSNSKNLVVILKLMSSKYQSIEWDAYISFKSFVGFEGRPQSVTNLIKLNSQNISDFLENLLVDNEQLYHEEKDYILPKILKLEKM